tara:strand:- start:156 stop:311 length:156 start_codon:yes stop_codon:yes gene_type:complete
VPVLVDVVDATRVERRGAANDAVHDIPLGEEKLGKVGAILAGDSGDLRRVG